MQWNKKRLSLNEKEIIPDIQDFYVSFLNCNQKNSVYSHLINAAHAAEKVHCKILEKCPQLIQWILGRILFFMVWYFLKH